MIIQTNVWICDKCSHIEYTAEQVMAWSDPVVTPPKGVNWSYEFITDEYGKELQVCNACFDKFFELDKHELDIRDAVVRPDHIAKLVGVVKKDKK